MTIPKDMDFTDANLIFLVSQPRAGSTLLQTILAGSEAVHTTAEPWFMLHTLYALRETGHTADYDATVAARALQDFLGTLAKGEETFYQATRSMALELYGQACRETGKQLFLDKTPRYYKILPELAQTFPQARFLILLRNPAAVLSSILHTWVKGDWNRLDYFRDDLLVAPRSLTEFVTESTGQTRVIYYESLVLKPDVTIRSLCEWLEIPYQPELLEYGQHPRPRGRYGDPTGVEKHQRPSADSLNTWLDHASDPQIHHLLSSYLDTLGPEQLAAMGYDSAQLVNEMAGVIRQPGKVTVQWEHLMKDDKSAAERLRLIVSGGRRERRPLETARQIARLLVGR